MPKFNDKEKEIIKQRLLYEGERLFTAFGVKKVSIDELVQTAGIAKGSFYSFYPSKEHLYMDIVGNQQFQIFREMDAFLENNRSLPSRELVKQCFLRMFEQLQRYPMLRKVNSETTDYLYRKLPSEVIEAHTKDDNQELIRLEKYGVKFKCSIEIAAKTLQTLAISFFTLSQNNADDKSIVMEIILNGVLKEIVSEEND